MIPTCAFTLDNRQPCGAPARHDSPFCRHHAPEVRARRHQDSSPASAAPPTVSDDPLADNPWILRGYWRMHHRLIPAFTEEEANECFAMVLEALADRQISPRSAGRLLLAILDRLSELASLAQEANLRDLRVQEYRQGVSNAKQGPFEALAKYPVSAATASRSSEARIGGPRKLPC